MVSCQVALAPLCPAQTGLLRQTRVAWRTPYPAGSMFAHHRRRGFALARCRNRPMSAAAPSVCQNRGAP